jgi:endonuclease-3
LAQTAGGKRPFDIDLAIVRLREAVRPFPPAALFELAAEGFNSPFEQTVACMISVRTLDEATVRIARRFFAVARTPAEVSRFAVEEVAELLRPATFYQNKAANVLAIARRAVSEFDGELPCEDGVLLSLPGIGPKCANLVLGIACHQPRIGVDIHVHRVTNRWGYVAASTPEATTLALTRRLPEQYWVEINQLLVPFGKHICTGRAPRCSTCPLLDMCQQQNVTSHR